MKRKIILFVSLLCGGAAVAQQTNFVYSYDASGNRIRRELMQQVAPSPLNVPSADSLVEQPAVQPEPTNALSMQAATQNTPAFEVRLFPNPTQGMVTLELPEWKTGETGQITIHSQMGALVFQQKHVTAAQTIYLGNLLPGYYVVRVIVGNKMVLTGIIKQ